MGCGCSKASNVTEPKTVVIKSDAIDIKSKIKDIDDLKEQIRLYGVGVLDRFVDE